MSASSLHSQQSGIRFGPCYATFDDGLLCVGNAHVQRRWRVQQGLLYAVSFRDLAANTEWLARPATHPSLYPGFSVPDEPRRISCTFSTGRASVTEEPSLVVELVAEGTTANLTYRFQVFPGARGVVTQLTTSLPENLTAILGERERRAEDNATGIEVPPASASAPAEMVDLVEYLEPAPQHLRLQQVVLLDQTDIHNELVFEQEWLLHPNEAHLRLQGNLFVLEDALTGNGLILLKHAPLPHARPARTECDLHVSGSAACFYGDIATFGPGHPAYPLAYRIALHGHGVDGAGGEGYPHVVLAYAGGVAGRTEALQTYQRQLRRYVPERDGQFLSNTWGDRSRDGRICETFIRQEVAAAARLGVDVVQIDDGWQRGRTANSVQEGGVWEGFWAADADFWEAHPERFPRGLAPVIEEARQQGLQSGLWFGPDSAQDFANWQRDAETILRLHRSLGINYIKIDGVKARTKEGERNLHRFFDAVLRESEGRVVFDLDVTAEIRPGYFGLMHAGPLFVENRYIDFHRYWPHQTLRNLWKLAHYVDPLRLRMEFLNNARHPHLYHGDPLAPASYRPAYLFATTMFANPLGWFEVSNLPQAYFDEVAPLARLWRAHRRAIFSGHIHPIGTAPDGTAWTGFASVADDRMSGYLLLFRERNNQPTWETPLPLFENGCACAVLAGNGSCVLANGRLTVHIPEAQDFLFVRVEAKNSL